jgi:hypothetical protein
VRRRPTGSKRRQPRSKSRSWGNYRGSRYGSPSLPANRSTWCRSCAG